MTSVQIPIDTSKCYVTNAEAVDHIAALLGSHEEWPVEALEWIADIVGDTGRPHPGNQSPDTLSRYRKLADELGYEHDGVDE